MQTAQYNSTKNEVIKARAEPEFASYTLLARQLCSKISYKSAHLHFTATNSYCSNNELLDYQSLKSWTSL